MNRTTDWFETIEIADDSIQLTEARAALPCNSFVVDGGDETLVIDTGLGIGDLREQIEGVVDGDPRLVLTHSHWDHIGAAHQFEEIVIHDRERSADGRVTIDTLSDEFVQRPAKFVESWRELGKEFPDEFDPDTYAIPPAENVGTIAPGVQVNVGDHTLEVFAAPGHSPGQIALLDHTTGVCYGADAIGIGGSLYAHFQDCDIEEYVDTFERLFDLYESGAFDTLATGHNDPYRGDDLEILEEMRVALGDILDDTADYEVVDTDWGPARQYNFGSFTVLTATTVT